ncbi:MCAT [Symbiodinium sp. CCMP2592]|nr:MCAT [Symbiodinium sp. CCMP2592]
MNTPSCASILFAPLQDEVGVQALQHLCKCALGVRKVCVRIGEASHPGPRPQPERPDLLLRDVPLVEPTTAGLQVAIWSRFLSWVVEGTGEEAANSISLVPEVLVEMLCAFGQVLYSSGSPLQHFRQLLETPQRRCPLCRPLLKPGWETLSRWERLEPVQHRPPLPEPIFEAMISLALSLGWFRWAVVTMLGFYGCCRGGFEGPPAGPSDAVRLAEGGLQVLPSDRRAQNQRARTEDPASHILSVTGPIKHKIHKLYVRTQGSDRRLLLSPGYPAKWVLLVDQAEYLGLIISYNHFEKQSVHHRLAKANHRRWALAPILHTKQMSIAYKLQLWQSCVLSTMMYALHCFCLSSGHIHSLQKTIMKHVRAIVSNQAFLKGTTHEEVMQKYHLRPLVAVFKKLLMLSSLSRMLNKRMHGLDQDMADFFGDYQDMEEMPGTMPPAGVPPRNPFTTPNKRRRDPFGTYRPTPSPFRAPQYPQGPHPPRAPHRDPLLFTLARTVLKQQEELQVLRQDTSYILFLKAGEYSALSHLYQTAVKFKKQQEADPGWKLGHVPLRMVLAVALFKELIDRLNQVLASQEKLKMVTDKGWRNESGWRFQRWNPTLKHLSPLPDDQLLDHLATILQCLKHPIVNRFTCKRKLTETMTSQATFVLDVSLRSQFSTTLWETLRLLQNNAVFQLIATNYKTENLGRSPMEQRIRDLMYGQQ